MPAPLQEPSDLDNRWFRLPALLTLEFADPVDSATQASPSVHLAPEIFAADQPGDRPTHQPSLREFKPLLDAALPYRTSTTADWQPTLSWCGAKLSPVTLQEAVKALLQPLTTAMLPEHSTSLQCGAVGLDRQGLQAALQHLTGIVVGIPAGWSDAYRLNLREAILSAVLVAQPSQITIVADAIAALLSELPDQNGHALVLPRNLPPSQTSPALHWQGKTLVLQAGAIATELMLADLPPVLANLSSSDFHLRAIAYGGDAIDQDILIQLFYPICGRQSSQTTSGETLWQELGFDALELPSPGEPDPTKRYPLQQRLLASVAGQTLLALARQSKLALQSQDQVRLTLADCPLVITRQDLGSRVFLPYVHRLNRELNTLLHQTQCTPLDILQVICTGGTASLGAIARWLRQKLPNATIIQDTYPPPLSPHLPCLPTCSRVAYGLAALPLHTQLFNTFQTYRTDLDLLQEVIAVFTDTPLSEAEIWSRLAHRGITQSGDRSRIQLLLEGQLPEGVLSSPLHQQQVHEEVHHPFTGHALRAASLFYQFGNHTYYPNPNHYQLYRSFLATTRKQPMSL